MALDNLDDQSRSGETLNNASVRNGETVDLEGVIDTGDAHEIALELMKQLITLSSGVLALGATFIEKFGDLPLSAFSLLGLAWFLLALSVLSGLETISAIVKGRMNATYDWTKGYGKKCALVAKYAFVGGLLAFAAFALVNALAKTSSPGPYSPKHFF